jgi:hypothetical protein
MPGFRRAIALTATVLCGLTGAGVQQAHAATPPGWRVFTLFSGKPYSDLLTMTATWQSSAWAFGDSAGPGSPPVALHWNGKTWTASRPFGDVPRPFYVSSTGGNNVWVTGQTCTSNGAYVSRWNGRRWFTTTFRNAPFEWCQAPVVTTGQANGWIFAKSAVSTLARHFNGKTWRASTIGKFGAVMAASAVSASNIWLLTETASVKMLLVHYDGRTWTSVQLPGVSLPKGEKPYAVSIDAVSGGNIWATADLITGHGGVDSGPVTSLLLHGNGKTWQWIKVPYDDSAQYVAYDAGSVWVGAQTNVQTGTGWDFLRWSPGNHWTRVPVPGIPGGDGTSYELYSLVHIPGTHSFFASADANYAVGTTAKAAAVVFKYGP